MHIKYVLLLILSLGYNLAWTMQPNNESEQKKHVLVVRQTEEEWQKFKKLVEELDCPQPQVIMSPPLHVIMSWDSN